MYRLSFFLKHSKFVNQYSNIKKLVLLLFLVSFPLLIHAQRVLDDRHQIDSIKRYVKRDVSNELKTEAYVDLAERFNYISIDTAFSYIDTAIVYGEKSNEIDWLVNAYTVQSRIFENNSEYKKVLPPLYLAIDISKKKGYNLGVEMSYSLMGSFYNRFGLQDSSIWAYNKGLEYADDEGKSILLNNIGLTYQNSGKNRKAADYYLKSINYMLGVENADLYLSNFYLNFGSLKRSMGNKKEALHYYQLASKAAISSGNQRVLSIIHDNIGNTYFEADNYDSAYFYLSSAKRIAQNIGTPSKELSATQSLCLLFLEFNQMDSVQIYLKQLNPDIEELRLQSEHYNIIGQFLMKKESYKESLDAFNKAISLATSDYDQKIALYKHKSELLEKMGNFKSALKWNKEYESGMDSIADATHKSYVSELEEIYENEKKEAEIAELSKQAEIQQLEIKAKNQWIIFGSLAFIAIVGGIYFWNKQRITKEKAYRAEVEQRFLRSQLNPHFIFNALDSIQSYVLKNDASQASRYMSKFAKLMRQVLENSREQFISLDEEVSMLENYMELQKLQPENDFSYTIHIDDKIDVDFISIPPMFVQPFVENAIEHGVISGNGEILIHFKKDDKLVNISVSDNGVGLSQTKTIATKQTTEHNSLATSIIKERIESYNEKLKTNIQLLVSEIIGESKEVLGTKVELKVPYQVN